MNNNRQQLTKKLNLEQLKNAQQLSKEHLNYFLIQLLQKFATLINISNKQFSKTNLSEDNLEFNLFEEDLKNLYNKLQNLEENTSFEDIKNIFISFFKNVDHISFDNYMNNQDNILVLETFNNIISIMNVIDEELSTNNTDLNLLIKNYLQIHEGINHQLTLKEEFKYILQMSILFLFTDISTSNNKGLSQIIEGAKQLDDLFDFKGIKEEVKEISNDVKKFFIKTSNFMKQNISSISYNKTHSKNNL